MAIDLFYRNFLTAAGYFTPANGAGHSGVPADDLSLRDVAIWLHPRSVEWFDPADFPFLDAERRAALQHSVERFQAAASKVPTKRPPTTEQVAEAKNAILDIIRLLRIDKFRDPDALRAQTILERDLQGKLPAWVTGIHCQTGTDSGGEPAMWIWIDVTDQAVEKRWVAKKGEDVHQTVEDAYERLGMRRWPYIRFRNPSDLVATPTGTPA